MNKQTSQECGVIGKEGKSKLEVKAVTEAVTLSGIFFLLQV